MLLNDIERLSSFVNTVDFSLPWERLMASNHWNERTHCDVTGMMRIVRNSFRRIISCGEHCFSLWTITIQPEYVLDYIWLIYRKWVYQSYPFLFWACGWSWFMQKRVWRFWWKFRKGNTSDGPSRSASRIIQDGRPQLCLLVYNPINIHEHPWTSIKLEVGLSTSLRYIKYSYI